MVKKMKEKDSVKQKDIEELKAEGLMYPTDDVVFDNWWKATLNKTVQDNVRLGLSHRSIALIMLD